VKIAEMHVGQSGQLLGHVGKDKAYRHKLLRMGLVKGVRFTILRVAPMGDPVEIEIKGFNLVLRRAEADVLEVEAVE
jgi:ferrous iron transport protein A